MTDLLTSERRAAIENALVESIEESMREPLKDTVKEALEEAETESRSGWRRCANATTLLGVGAAVGYALGELRSDGGIESLEASSDRFAETIDESTAEPSEPEADTGDDRKEPDEEGRSLLWQLLAVLGVIAAGYALKGRSASMTELGEEVAETTRAMTGVVTDRTEGTADTTSEYVEDVADRAEEATDEAGDEPESEGDETETETEDEGEGEDEA